MQCYGSIVASESDTSVSSGGEESEDEILDAKSGVENIGVAVFRQDKLIGTLSPIETISHLIVTNKIKSCNISMPDPEDNENLIDLYFDFSKNPDIDVSIVNGTPYIKVKITANATISSIKQLSNTNTEKQIKLTQEYANSYIEKLISHYLYRTSKELKSDCASLGNYALKNFKTVQELENYNWLQHYQDAFFNVECNITVDSGFLLTGI